MGEYFVGRDRDAAALDSHPDMEVRRFNPFSRKTSRASQFVTRMGSVTRPFYNKSFTVDNQVTILGGRNIGDAYFEAVREELIISSPYIVPGNEQKAHRTTAQGKEERQQGVQGQPASKNIRF